MVHRALKTEVEHSGGTSTCRVGLRLAAELLKRQRRILVLMMAERTQRLEASTPEERPQVAKVWGRAVQQQAKAVKQLAAEVERIHAQAGQPFPELSHDYAA